MKIAYVVRQIDNAGGRERIVTIKANYLARRFGFDVTIITMFQHSDAVLFPIDPLVRVHHLRLEKSGNPLTFTSRARKALTASLRELAPDVTISMWWGPEFELLPTIPYGGRKVVEQHFSQFMRDRLLTSASRSFHRRLRARLSRIGEDAALRRYDALVLLTQEDRAFWEHARLEVIPNPVTFTTPDSSDCSAPVVIAVGRLEEQKGFDRLLRIWARVESRHPGWRLLIRGHGEDRDALNSQIGELGLQRAVIEPPVPRIQEELLAASILAFTSRYEGFGLVLTEAMQCGLPVVSYDTKCGPRDIIDDGVTGFLVREDDETAFADRLERLIQDRQLRLAMGAAGKRSVNERFSEARVMETWKRFFESL